MNRTTQVSASLEDYLEAIFWIAAAKGAARVKDIAERLRVKAASVTGALRALSARNYINYAPYEVITLTDKGLDTAKKVVRRHEILKDFFTGTLGIDAEVAEEAACKLEHNIPHPIAERLIDFVEFVQVCPRAGEQWVENFAQHCKTPGERNCEQCVELCIRGIKSRGLALVEQGQVALTALKPKQKGVVVKINCRGLLAKRLAEMGLVRQAVVEVQRVAPLGDPMEIKVRGYRLSLRKDEAANVIVAAR